jgi:hypothetical protein
MNINSILGELIAERDRIGRAIAVIEGLNSSGRSLAGRQAAVVNRRKRGRLSAAARKKLSRLLKQRWAQGKMKREGKAKTAQPSKPGRRMSAAGRKRIAEAAKRRWAEWRKKSATKAS